MRVIVGVIPPHVSHRNINLHIGKRLDLVMTEVQIEFENYIDYETDECLDDLFKEIKEIDAQINDYIGMHYSLTYFYGELDTSFWRFDWGYMWDRTNQDLKALLKEAIEAGKGMQ